MLRRFMNTAGVCGVGIAFSSLFCGGVYAADFSTKAAPVPYAADDFWTRPYLFGDLGRTRLKEQGIDIGLTLGNESVGNVSGGSRNTAANAGQLWFGAKLDMGKLAGIPGGTVGLTLVDRFGKNLNTEADIPALQLTNEVFGRGNILRLTQLYYSQKLFDDRLELKGGRLPVGSDFFFGLCEFINLTFCGGQPGNIQGGYIYNWPVSQWAGVVHYKDRAGIHGVGRCLRCQSGLPDDVRPGRLLLARHSRLEPRQWRDGAGGVGLDAEGALDRDLETWRLVRQRLVH